MNNPNSVNSAPEGDLPRAAERGEEFASGDPHRDLKGRTIRGGALTVLSQIAQFLISTISIVLLARLLTPEDFGLVGMAMAVIGSLGIVRDSGLSAATIQRKTVTRDLISTVFWLNIAVGSLIALLCVALAPVLAAFFREPRLLWITLVLSTALLFDAAGAQHVALLRRQMRLKAVAGIELASAVVSVALSIAMAFAGFGYWALVSSRISGTLTITLGAWLLESWRPGLPRRNTGVRSMLRFGANLTGAGVMYYAFRNIDNVLIGWRWGAASLGIYQKAYGLLLLPINQVGGPIRNVAVATLSRIQSEPDRYRRYFIEGFSISASIVLPIVVAAAIYSEDIIRFVLGDQWIASSEIFRLLVPAAMIGALSSPLGWLFVSSGRADRQFRAGFVWSSLIIGAFVLGLPYGPKGVAIGFSAMSALLAAPLCLYAVQGTPVRIKDMVLALKFPIIAGMIAGLAGVLLESSIPIGTHVSMRAIGGCFSVVSVYVFVLLGPLGQWSRYRELAKHFIAGRQFDNDP